MADGLLEGPDGRLRCAWAGSAPEYLDYHDTEWGREVRGDSALFERMSLEAFQSGLSWITILRKREAFRAAFRGFDLEQVATFGEDDVHRLLQDAGIVRNRAKIEATIANARAVLDLDEPLSDLLWSFAPTRRPAPEKLAEVPATTPESTALAKALKKGAEVVAKGGRYFIDSVIEPGYAESVPDQRADMVKKK